MSKIELAKYVISGYCDHLSKGDLELAAGWLASNDRGRFWDVVCSKYRIFDGEHYNWNMSLSDIANYIFDVWVNRSRED